MIITIDDVRNAGFCVEGLRQFCEDNGIDLKAAIRDGGIDSEVLVETGNQGVLDAILRSKGELP